MKGLMVSLIIVIFAGMASSVSAAGQQAGEDAAGFKPRLGLQPLRALERPGPDDSEDEVNWPEPTSLLSRNSTTTSNSFSGQQFGGSPAPESSVDKNIRFDVKVDDVAISKLRQGLRVFSPVDVKDASTNVPLHPEVVSDIALFHGANAGKNLQGVRLEPAPMEPGSTTLKFEINEDQLDRIEDDAFLFSVPEQLRGTFDRVEFVAVRGPTGSHSFSSGVSGGTRGTGFGLADPNGRGRFGTNQTNQTSQTNQSNRFGSTSDPSEFAERWNTESPQPGPNFEPGDRRFMGPAIAANELEVRDRVSPITQNRNVAQPNGSSLSQDQSTLNTSGRFQVADRETDVNSFGRRWQQPGNNQGTNGQPNNLRRQNLINQRNQPTLAEQQLAAMQKQLADERAEKEWLARKANDLEQSASRLAQENNEYSQQLRVARQQGSPSYSGRALNVVAEAVRPFGAQRQDFQTQEPTFAVSEADAAHQRTILALERQRDELLRDKDHLWKQNEQLNRDNHDLAAGRVFPQRAGAAGNKIQPTSYSNSDDSRDRYVSTADARDAYGYQQPVKEPEVEQRRRQVAGQGGNGGRKDEQQEEVTPTRSRSSDLIWLLPLLLGSLGLNFFLWIHCRTLDLRYNDLADELRGMVGTSTVV